MPKIAYTHKNFRGSSLQVIDWANEIITEYAAQGFSLTLRQLYYQMVARGLIANNQKSYKRIGGIIADARMAGLVDWLAIEDRTRALRGNTRWKDPQQIMESAIAGYQIDKWQNQHHRVEVWVEKDALTGVLAGICSELDIDFFSCRGYTSASEMWKAANRLGRYVRDGQDPVLLHFGDHDPSGIDMTRDIVERLDTFTGTGHAVERVALNMDQIEQYDPPPNPAKLSDSRADGYIRVHGHDSWELDALEPLVIVELIEAETLRYRDEEAWAEMVEREEEERDRLRAAMGML